MKHNSDGAQPTARKAKAKKVNVQELDIAVRERLDDKKLNDEVFHLNKNDGLGSGDDLHGRRKFLIGAAGGLASLGAPRSARMPSERARLLPSQSRGNGPPPRREALELAIRYGSRPPT